ncbi:hypothetical protein [Pseudomonas sp. CFBP 5750]
MGGTLSFEGSGVVGGFAVEFAYDAGLFDHLNIGDAIGADITLLLVELTGLVTGGLERLGRCRAASGNAPQRPGCLVDGVE